MIRRRLLLTIVLLMVPCPALEILILRLTPDHFVIALEDLLAVRQPRLGLLILALEIPIDILLPMILSHVRITISLLHRFVLVDRL